MFFSMARKSFSASLSWAWAADRSVAASKPTTNSAQCFMSTFLSAAEPLCLQLHVHSNGSRDARHENSRDFQRPILQRGKGFPPSKSPRIYAEGVESQSPGSR